jgi:hypothetical protein
MKTNLTARINGKLGVRLLDTNSNAHVFWSVQGNSYIVVEPTLLELEREVGRLWIRRDETRVMLYSINGCNEIRWAVPHSGSTSGDLDAAKYFQLVPFGKIERTQIPPASLPFPTTRTLESDVQEDR